MHGKFLTIFLLVFLTSLSGCRIGAAVFKGGDVVSGSGTRDCGEGRTCEFEVSDTNFQETFTAQPRVGYEFVKWRGGDNYLCANSTNPVCTVSNIGTAGNPVIETIVASDEMFYVVPEFRCVISYCPEILLDSVLLELEDASDLVSAYVEQNGSYPDQTTTFGISTYLRPAPSLLAWLQVRPFGLIDGSTVYINAAVYRSLWNGTGTPNPAAVAYFSLSGSTNAGNTMTWECIPGAGPGAGFSVPIAYLPIECRW